MARPNHMPFWTLEQLIVTLFLKVEMYELIRLYKQLIHALFIIHQAEQKPK
jgi:hypothetical protein